MTDRHTKAQRSKNMRAVKNKDSYMELAVRRSLWARGRRFRKHHTGVPGKPDIAFPRYKVAVFLDSEFWHGHDWERRKHDIKSNREFWYPKIERNIARDREVDRLLADLEWTVLRFWEKAVKRDVEVCADAIEAVLRQNA